MNPDLARMIAALGGSQPRKGPAGTSRLTSAMMGQRRGRAGDAKYASLAALPTWAEQQHAGSFGAAGTNSQQAFQLDAFQDDAYQVF